MSAGTLRADAVAGFIGALLVLPQGVAFATLAGLPPQYGLYAGMVPVIVAALWGSSWHLVSGPTNATSLMVFASLSAVAVPFTDDYVRLALTLNLMLGVVKLVLGLARLGSLTNFISQTVVVGFTAGAGLLIVSAQLRNFLGLTLPGSAAFGTAIANVAAQLRETDPAALAVGTFTLVAAMVCRRLSQRIPQLLVGLLAGSLLGAFLNGQGIAHLATVGSLPSALPPLSLPDLHPETLRSLAPAAFALTLIGLTEAISSARAVALRSGQRLDANQEFIGQGLANLAGAFTSASPCSGSFNRSGASFEAGAHTPLAAVFSALFLVLVLLLVAPLATYMPIAAMAGLLFLVAWGLIDIRAMRRIARTSRAEAAVLAITFVATLTVQLEFAIFVGVLASLVVYLGRTTRPRLTPLEGMAGPQILPVERSGEIPLVVLRMDGSLFFGAVTHVADQLEAVRAAARGPVRLVLVGSGMNFIDVAGAELLLQEARVTELDGGALYLCELKPPVRDLLERGGYLAGFGADRVFPTLEDARVALFSGAPRP